MSVLDNKKRELGVKADDYYDDRYDDEEYDEYEEDNSSKKSLFSFLKRNNDDEYEETYEEEERPRTYSSYSSRASERKDRFTQSFQKTAQTPSRTNMAGVEVIVHYPASLDEATRIIREVKNNKITLFDISAITSDAEARRAVDYIGGAAFGMEWPFERLCPSIFCIAPMGVKLDAKKRY